MVLGGILAALCVISVPAFAQLTREADLGNPIIRNYSTGAEGYDVINFSCVRDTRGVLWVANPFGLLEYDGVTWRVLSSVNHLPVFSVACADDGTIYFGSLGTFGRVVLDARGSHAMELLKDSIPAGVPSLSRVDQIHVIGRDVWFCSDEALIRRHGSGWDVVLPASTFLSAFPAGGQLYVQDEETGLCRIENGRAVPLPDARTFAGHDQRILFLESADGGLLIGTRQGTVYRYDGVRAFPVWNVHERIGEGVRLQCGLQLQDGTFALGTLRRGIWITTRDGDPLIHLDQDVGLIDDGVNALSLDDDGALWAALSDGVSRIEWPARVTEFGRELGIDGQVSAIARFHGTLYAATTHGLHRLHPAYGHGTAFTRARFALHPEIPHVVLDMHDTGRELLIATQGGVMALQEDGRLLRLSQRSTRLLHAVHGSADTIITGNEKGLDLLVRTVRGWRHFPLFENPRYFIVMITETPDGLVWASGADAAVIRLDPAAGIREASLRFFDAENGLPQGPVLLHAINGEPLLVTELYTLRWNAAEERFVEARDFLDAFHPPLPIDPRFLHQSERGELWMQLFNGDAGFAERGNGGMRFDPAAFSRVSRHNVLCMHTDADGTLWFGTDDRVLRYDPKARRQEGRPFAALLRAFLVDGVSRWRGDGTPPADHRIRLTSDHRRVRFEVAAPVFGVQERVRYRCRLDGFDSSWHELGSSTFAEYFFLPPGRYRFRVRAVNAEGVMSSEGRLVFSVAAPWYRSWNGPATAALYLGGVLTGLPVWALVLAAALLLLVVGYVSVVGFAPWMRVHPLVIARAETTAEPAMTAEPGAVSPGTAAGRRTVTFRSGDAMVEAWYYRPARGRENVPCVVMANGFGGTRDMGLEPYALRFRDAGMAVLIFDYRCLGGSGGLPRQLIWIPEQKRDWRAAVAWVQAQPEVDPRRVALWGTSASGAYVVDIASEDLGVAAVVAQCAGLDGSQTGGALLRQIGLRRLLRLIVHGQRDMFRRFLGRSPHRIPIAGPRGSLAALPFDEAWAYYTAAATPAFRNEVCARILLRGDKYRPFKRAGRVRCPVLWQMCEKDVMNPSSATALAEEVLAGRIEVRRYPVGHFDIYRGEHFARAVADQVSFLRRHLLPGEDAEGPATEPRG